jgi:hypothetical protein
MGVREVREHKNKIYMVLEANGPMTTNELACHPAVNEDGRGVNAVLRALARDKRVSKNGDKWSPHVDNKAAAKMYFVMNLKTRSFQLEIGGVRLPLIVEQ